MKPAARTQRRRWWWRRSRKSSWHWIAGRNNWFNYWPKTNQSKECPDSFLQEFPPHSQVRAQTQPLTLEWSKSLIPMSSWEIAFSSLLYAQMCRLSDLKDWCMIKVKYHQWIPRLPFVFFQCSQIHTIDDPDIEHSTHLYFFQKINNFPVLRIFFTGLRRLPWMI